MPIHWTGLELWKRLRYFDRGTLSYYRTQDGAEADFVIEINRQFIPIEVKWTENPSPEDARNVVRFLADHPKSAARGYVVCRCRRPTQLHDHVLAIPWSDL